MKKYCVFVDYLACNNICDECSILKIEKKEGKQMIKRGEIQVVHGNMLRLVTEVDGEETIDLFTFDEIINFILLNEKEQNNESNNKAEEE